MAQVALTTFIVSIIGLIALVIRRLPDIAAIPTEFAHEKRGRFLFVTEAGTRIIKFWWDLLIFIKRVGFWIVHFSLEKTLRKVRIVALKIENFSARKLEDMRAHSHDVPHFSFFDDIRKKEDNKGENRQE